MCAYTVGVQFDLVVRLRTSPGGRRGPSPGDWPGAGLGDSLLLGVEFSDGRAASSLGSGLGGAADDDAPLLVQAGGGGDDRSWDESWWLHPVPSPGPLRFVFAAPALGVEETHAVVDGGLLAAAAESAVVLWPPQPPDDLEPPDLPPPPAGGWFGRLAQGPRRLLGDA